MRVGRTPADCNVVNITSMLESAAFNMVSIVLKNCVPQKDCVISIGSDPSEPPVEIIPKGSTAGRRWFLG